MKNVLYGTGLALALGAGVLVGSLYQRHNSEYKRQVIDSNREEVVRRVDSEIGKLIPLYFDTKNKLRVLEDALKPEIEQMGLISSEKEAIKKNGLLYLIDLNPCRFAQKVSRKTLADYCTTARRIEGLELTLDGLRASKNAANGVSDELNIGLHQQLEDYRTKITGGSKE